MTYYGGDAALWGTMAAALSKRASQTVSGGQTMGAVLTGTIIQSSSGAYLQTKTKSAVKIALPSSAVADAPTGSPALVSVLN